MGAASAYTLLEKARFERKFVIERGGIRYAEKLIKFNPGAFKPIFHKRQVNNVYFDSHNLTNYYDNHFGKSQRVKTRIRWYGETFGEIREPILEFKLKFGAAGKKESFALKPFVLNENTDKTEWAKLFNSSELPDYVRNELKNQLPTLLNAYERKYFQSFDQLFRFTLDYNLQFYNIKSFNNTFNRKPIKIESIILELKYDLNDDRKVKNITSSIPSRLGKFSKYANGVELFNEHLAI